MCIYFSVFANYLKRRTNCFAFFYFSNVAMLRVVVLGVVVFFLLTPFKFYDICYSKRFSICSPLMITTVL